MIHIVRGRLDARLRLGSAAAVCLGVLAVLACTEAPQRGDLFVDLPPDSPAPSAPETPPSPPALEGIRILPGESIQAAVDAHPPGTTFILAAGLHPGQTVRPRNGDTFVGEPGAIMDGRGTVEYAFDGSDATRDVTIRGLVIERYAPRPQDGAIMGGRPGEWYTEGWVIENNEIRNNTAEVRHRACTSASGCGGMGIKLGNRMVIRGNNIHHNDEYGIGGRGDDVLVEGNEIAYNNHRRRLITGFGAGGTKFVHTQRLVVRNNYVHDNWGNGLWTDIQNSEALIEGNRVENNAGQGIFHEIGSSITIRDNVVKGNGFGLGRWAYGAGILIGHSAGAEVYGNLVEDNYNGILAIQQTRGTHRLDNLWVHDNTVIQTGRGRAAGVLVGGALEPLTGRELAFDHNRYILGTGDDYFAWMRGSRSVEEWRALGQDVSSTFDRAP